MLAANDQRNGVINKTEPAALARISNHCDALIRGIVRNVAGNGETVMRFRGESRNGDQREREREVESCGLTHRRREWWPCRPKLEARGRQSLWHDNRYREGSSPRRPAFPYRRRRRGIASFLDAPTLVSRPGKRKVTRKFPITRFRGAGARVRCRRDTRCGNDTYRFIDSWSPRTVQFLLSCFKSSGRQSFIQSGVTNLHIYSYIYIYIVFINYSKMM